MYAVATEVRRADDTKVRAAVCWSTPGSGRQSQPLAGPRPCGCAGNGRWRRWSARRDVQSRLRLPPCHRPFPTATRSAYIDQTFPSSAQPRAWVAFPFATPRIAPLAHGVAMPRQTIESATCVLEGTLVHAPRQGSVDQPLRIPSRSDRGAGSTHRSGWGWALPCGGKRSGIGRPARPSSRPDASAGISAVSSRPVAYGS